MTKNLTRLAYTKYRIHIIIWSIFIIYETIVAGVFSGQFGSLENYIVHYVLNIVLFYLNCSGIIKISNHPRKTQTWIYPLFVFSEIILYVPVLAIANQIFTTYNQPTALSSLGIDHKFILGAVYRAVFFIMVSTGYAFLRRYLNERKITEDLKVKHLVELVNRRTSEKNLVISKNAFRKAQVNPHLLFNALSFVHRRIRKVDALAGEMVISLTDLMRYAISTENNTDFVLLSQEIANLETLTSIFKAINGDRFNFTLSLSNNIGDTKIIPLLIISLAENMYKHGDLTNPQNPGILTITVTKDVLKIYSRNAISEYRKAESHDKGLILMRDRIIEFYGKESTIDYSYNDQIFEINMTLPLIDDVVLNSTSDNI